MADFAWYDWTDKMPLVVVTEGGEQGVCRKVLQRWDGNNVGGRWFPVVRDWLNRKAEGTEGPRG